MKHSTAKVKEGTAEPRELVGGKTTAAATSGGMRMI